MQLAGKTAVVTGGGSGIGRAISLRLGRDGARVAIFDLNRAGAETVAEQIRHGGGHAIGLETDVSDADSVKAAADRVHRELGPASIVVNNAGFGELVLVAQMTAEQWDRMIAVHLKGTFLCSRAFMDDMTAAGWGRIVNMASVAGITGSIGYAHYAAAKAGIIAFTKSLAQELGPRGVTVNAIAPGLIDTPVIHAGLPQKIIDGNLQRQSIKRLGTPEDIAAACAYLVSDEAGYFTGQVMSPNGGVYM